MGFFLELFTWWNGQTLSTRLFTKKHGVRVGEDAAGNVYYKHKPKGKPEKRWVIYKGVADASKISAEWHTWMHHKTNTPPTEEKIERRAWQKPHEENFTGTAKAYRPKGSLFNETPVLPEKEYQSWSPQ